VVECSSACSFALGHLAANVNTRNRERAARLIGAVEGVTDAPSDAMVDVQQDAPEEDAPDSADRA
jgi:hypothetical protein